MGNINSVDINLNEVSDHSDFSDTEVVPTYFDFESSVNIEDMMTALDKDIIFSNDGPIPDNDNSFANLEDKVEDIENNEFQEEYQPSESETEEQTEKRRVQCRKAPNIAHWLLT